MKKAFVFFFVAFPAVAIGQSIQKTGSGYWQQRVKYSMEVDVEADANRFSGKQKLDYWNNSPDTLTKLFYHLYWNAFQPGSMMDTRSRRQGTMQNPRGLDWDNRVRDRIQNLKDNEIGYQKIVSLKVNGRVQKFNVLETILEVRLDKPIPPGTKAVMDLVFEAQVPVQIRRSGRDNAEGIRFSMSQWYPKLCEYDKNGWHPNPYIGREFYGVWGDFDVKISIDRTYIIGASGYLKNANQVGYGYEAPGARVDRPAGKKLLWHFNAPNVHDFVWAADPGYTHQSKKVREGMVLHAFYKIDLERLKMQYTNFSEADKTKYGNSDNFVAYYKRQWEEVLDVAALALPVMDQTFGKYPYDQFSIIQGGDGGMEYPMATLVKGAGPELVIHEWMHSWYQMVLGTNESLYPWMDEGFTSYAEARILARLTRDTGFAFADNYKGYYTLARSNKEEPLTTHADHYNMNFSYSNAAYSKGAVFMEQLGYITGAAVRDRILLDYFKQWRFKHPDVNDFINVAEKASGLQLDWYKEYWINSTKTIDYAIDSLWEEGGKTKIRLSRQGLMPMPIDLQLTFKDGSRELHYIPLDLMYGEKPDEGIAVDRKVYAAWKWTHPDFTIETNRKLLDLSVVEIDPTQRLADVEKKNNKLELKW